MSDEVRKRKIKSSILFSLQLPFFFFLHPSLVFGSVAHPKQMTSHCGPAHEAVPHSLVGLVRERMTATAKRRISVKKQGTGRSHFCSIYQLAFILSPGRLLLEQKATLLGSFLLLAAVIAFSGRITMNSGAPRTSFSERTFCMKNDGNDDELHEAHLKWKDFLYRIRQGFNLQMDQFKGYLFNHWKESDDVLQEHHGK